jgi:hypothetical protein
MSEELKTYTESEMHEILAANAGITIEAQVMKHNSSDASMRRAMSAMIQGGYHMADTLHTIWCDYGYPAQLTFPNFYNMYSRFGIAGRVVKWYPQQTWLADPIVTGGEKFESELKKVNKKVKLWSRLYSLDTRQRVGRYAGAFMRVKDSKKPNEPIEGMLPSSSSLIDIIPLYESQLVVSETQNDPTKDDFDMPTMYQLTTSAVGNRNDRAGQSFEVHPSRIIIASEDSDNSGIYGVPVLEDIFNDLMDLNKILGAGGEGFYKNAAQNIVFDLNDTTSAVASKPLLDKFNANYDEFAQDRFRRALWTPGMTAKTLESNLIPPKEFAMNSLYSIAAGANMSVFSIIGNQTGQLASDQNSKADLAQVQARREDFGTELVSDAMDWCIKYGILPTADYEVTWPDALEPSFAEKLESVERMANVNEKQFRSGQRGAFTAEEMREQVGFETKVDLPLPTETIEEDDIDA